ncbi:MAG: hypothetical protein LBM68_02190, partial [Bacteroidales bacterium]|nr:hypothetical protein [Bacteroidales bacterium]
MKTTKNCIKILLISIVCVVGINSVQAQTCTTTVGGSTFDASPTAADDYRDINSTQQLGPSGNKLSTPVGMITETTKVGSDPFYVMVDNPILVDEEILDIDESMMIIGGRGTNAELFSYEVNGLKAGSTVTVTLEGYLLNSTASNACKGVSNSTNDPKLQILFDPQTNNGNSANWATGYTKDQSIKSALGNGKFTITVSVTLPATQTGFTYAVKSGYNYASCMLIGFSNIKVTGCLNPKIISSQGAEVCEGEQVRLELDREYYGSTYKWERSTNGTSGWTTEGTTKNILSKVDKTYYYRCTVDGVVSEIINVTTVKCCELAPGVSSSRKTIFHEDFGTFLSATSYEDKDGNPKAATAYTVPGPTIAGGSFENNEILCVLHTTSGPWKTGGLSGDASGNANGGFLFLNPNSPFKGPIYDQTITGLCDDKKLFMEVSIANASYVNSTTPPQVDLILYSVPGGAQLGRVSSSLTATDQGWRKLKIDDIILPAGNTSARLVVDSRGENWTAGNDLLVDDIIFRICTPPTVDIYSNLSTLNRDTTICDKNSVTLAAPQNDLLDAYYGGNANLRYLYQYSYDGTTWQNIGGSAASAIKTTSSLTEALTSHKGNQEVYFRIIVANQTYLTPFLTNPNPSSAEKCNDVSISLPLIVTLDCPCLTPPSVKIANDKVPGAKTITLCIGETVELSATPAPSAECTTQWFNQIAQPSAAATSTISGTTYSVTATAAGTQTYWAKVIETVDNRTECQRFDKVTVQVNIAPAENLGNEVCIADPKTPTASEEICFVFASNYANGTYTGSPADSEFEVYQRETGTTAAGVGTVSIASSNGSTTYCVPGDQVEVIVGTDTTYNIYLEDKTIMKGALGATPTATGSTFNFNSYYYGMTLEVLEGVALESLDIDFKNRDSNNPRSFSVTPYIFNIREQDANNRFADPMLYAASATSVSLEKGETKSATLALDPNFIIPAGTYMVVITGNFDNIDALMQNYGSEFDNVGGTTLHRVDSRNMDKATSNVRIQNGTLSGSAFYNLTFSKSVANECNRIKLTTTYKCPPCEPATLDLSSAAGTATQAVCTGTAITP